MKKEKQIKDSVPKQMSALCVAQPWATCIFRHGKNVENSSRGLNKRGTIAIYASASYAKWRFEICRDVYRVSLDFDDLTKGVILGFVTIAGVIEPKQKKVPSKYRKWWQREFYGFILEDIVLLKNPISVKPPNGAVKFWHLKGKTLEKCLSQVSSARLKNFKEWK